MNRSFDVIVVGARVAGAATAMLLARAGLEVLCIDKSRYGSDTLSTHALMRGGVQLLHRWGLLDDLVAAGTPPVRRTVFHYGDDSVGVSIKPSGGIDALYAPRRTLIDALLVDAAVRAGAVVAFGATVTGLDRDDDGRVTGVVISSRRGATERIARAPLVIGADGRNSLVAREVGAVPIASGRAASSFLYGYWANVSTAGYEWFYSPGLAAGAIPTNAGLTCLFIGSRPAFLDAAVPMHGASAVFDRLAAPAGLPPGIEVADRVGSIRYARGLPAGYLRAAHGPGWALVGDAGHWLDPMSTHGMTSALRDAALLARAILSATPSGVQLPRALMEYQAVRDQLSLPMMAVTEEIASYTWDLTRIRALLRSLSSAMTDEVETLAAVDAAA
jgi:2-polyprenyl-6-methoxyphenol hydroxylase-like FAD-dependent oxidoreductase